MSACAETVTPAGLLASPSTTGRRLMSAFPALPYQLRSVSIHAAASVLALAFYVASEDGLISLLRATTAQQSLPDRGCVAQ
jgi:hypothetical protein